MTTPYQSFAQLFSSYHEQYAQPEAGPSSRNGVSKQHIDSQIPYNVVLDDEGGLLSSLNKSLEAE
jgi:nuclear pore complex protein Nup107